MLSSFLNALKVPDLRAKLVFTLAMIGVYRFGSWLPVPYADVQALESVRSTGGAGGSIVQVLNLFSGGALTAMAVFALGIMPYITASIIMQLLTVVIPRLETLQQEGEQGRAKITQYTRYITVVLALLQSSGLVTLAANGQLFGTSVLGPDVGFWKIVLIVVTLTAGTSAVMWLGELITQRGVGNGMSLLIYVSIISQFPSQFRIVFDQGQQTFALGGGYGLLTVLFLVGVVITVAVVFMEQGQRRVPVQYARRQVGRRTYGGQSTYIPLKVNQSGVIPVIFASSMLYLPTLAASVTGWGPLVDFNETYLSPQAGITWVYIVIFSVMTIFFAYFYTAIAFNPVEVADNMKRYGGFVPGIRPGTQTAEYLDRVLTRITLPGSLYLTTVAIIPFVALAVFDIQAFPLGGVGLLIMVGVALETMKQIDSQLMQRNYDGFLS